MTKFKAKRGGIEVRIEPGEAAVLRELVGQVRALLHDRAEQTGAPPSTVSTDVLETMVTDGYDWVEPPDDPAVARLLPEARREADADAAEYRRLTEGDLRRGKLRDSDALLDSLPHEGGRLMLDREMADAWLRALNDVRLAMGTRLGVEEETTMPSVPTTPEEHALAVYFWLGAVQESLLAAVTGQR